MHAKEAEKQQLQAKNQVYRFLQHIFLLFPFEKHLGCYPNPFNNIFILRTIYFGFVVCERRQFYLLDKRKDNFVQVDCCPTVFASVLYKYNNSAKFL